jgi:hypothetical protein
MLVRDKAQKLARCSEAMADSFINIEQSIIRTGMGEPTGLNEFHGCGQRNGRCASLSGLLAVGRVVATIFERVAQNGAYFRKMRA